MDSDITDSSAGSPLTETTGEGPATYRVGDGDQRPRAAAVTFVTTEHFALQGARAATISESTGRASVFLGAVSGGLIALGFIGQASRLGAAFYAFGLILLPTLAFVGLTTFHRVFQSGLEDARYAHRIALLRAFYFDAAPEVEQYLVSVPPGERQDVQGVWVSSAQKFLTMAGTVAVVTAVVTGSAVGLLGSVVSGHSPWVAFPAGAVAASATLILLIRFLGAQMDTARQTFQDEEHAQATGPIGWSEGPSRPLDEAEVRVIAGAVAAAVQTTDGLTAVQRAVLNPMCEFLLGFAVDLETVERVGSHDFAEVMRHRSVQLRTRIVQAMELGAMLLAPLPDDVTTRVEEYAARLGVTDDMLRVAREYANGSLSLAVLDFERSGYFEQLRMSRPVDDGSHPVMASPWETTWDDEELHRRWAALGDCPDESLGRSVWEFYTARGFVFPGRPGSAPPRLAQHDWVHVLADYGSTIESEIEVFALIARANDNPRAFSLLAMVIGLFETGYLADAAGGFFSADRGHLSRDADRMGVRLADAMARGKKLGDSLNAQDRAADTDLLGLDWFDYGNRPLADVRAEFDLQPKSPRAIAAGSVSPWEPGAISEYQYRQGQVLAGVNGREYDSFGAQPAETSGVTNPADH
jgi:hypothetical protein